MTPNEDALIGRVIAETFRIDKLVARGGFSSVFRGSHLKIDRPVAIKVLQIDENVQATWIERFSREAKVVSQLSHPNTITIFDYGQVGSDFLYIIMEYVRGRSLSRYVKKFGPIPPERLIRFAVQIARALDEAHHIGIVHRDLKPSNIMVSVASSGEETIKVLDFGVAKLLDPEPDVDMQLTQIGAFVGTPRYASPEQLRREELDHRSDIYGLGMIMWECLTGAPAVEATDYGTCLQYHLGPEPWRLPAGIDIPDPLAEIVHTCLEKERANRYLSCGHVADALEECIGRMQYGETNRLEVVPSYHLEFLNESSEFGAYTDSEWLEELDSEPDSDVPDNPTRNAPPPISNRETAIETVEADSAELAESAEIAESAERLRPLSGGEDLFEGFEDEGESQFLNQYDDGEGVPEDLLAGPAAVTPDGQRVRSFSSKDRTRSQRDRDERDEAQARAFRGSDSGEPQLPGWDEGLSQDPLGEGGRRPPTRSAQTSPRRTPPADQRRQTGPAAVRPAKSGSPFIPIAIAFALLLVVGVVVAVALSFFGDSVNSAEIEHEKAAAEEVENLLKNAQEPKAAANDGTPTISPMAIIMALRQGGWKMSSMEENDLGSIKSTSFITTKDDMAASVTIYKTKSFQVAEELLAETRSPTEGITFGSTLVRVAPGPSRNKSGVTPVVSRLYEFKTVALESAAESRDR